MTAAEIISDFETSLNVLTVLSDALTSPGSLDEGLQRVTQMTCELMATEQTVVLLRDEDRCELLIRSQTGYAGNQVRVGNPLRVPDRIKSILWRVRSLHQINAVDAGIAELGFPILVAPLRITGTRIGLLITGKPQGEFDKVRRRLYRLVASFASLIIQSGKAQDCLRQHFAHHSQELMEANRQQAGDGDETRCLMISSLTNPEKVVGLLAESFYKELRSTGFSMGQVTTAAARLLECITREDVSAPAANGS